MGYSSVGNVGPVLGGAAGPPDPVRPLAGEAHPPLPLPHRHLCLFLTVIVLRGTIGAGKFGTPEQDVNEIRQRLRHHRSLSDRAIVEHQTDHSSAATTGKTFVPDEGDDDPPRDPNIPYSLGPKISYWDDQRAA